MLSVGEAELTAGDTSRQHSVEPSLPLTDTTSDDASRSVESPSSAAPVCPAGSGSGGGVTVVVDGVDGHRHCCLQSDSETVMIGAGAVRCE